MYALFLADSNSDAVWNCCDIIFNVTTTDLDFMNLPWRWVNKKIVVAIIIFCLYRMSRVAQVMILVTILSDQSVVCSIFTPPF